MINKSVFFQFKGPNSGAGATSGIGGQQSRATRITRSLLLFSPGIMLVLLGIGFILAPRFFLALIAVFFVFLGVFVSVMIYRFLKFKRTLENSAREFQQSFRVQTFEVNPSEDSSDDSGEDDQKRSRIVLH